MIVDQGIINNKIFQKISPYTNFNLKSCCFVLMYTIVLFEVAYLGVGLQIQYTMGKGSHYKCICISCFAKLMFNLNLDIYCSVILLLIPCCSFICA